MIVKNGGVNVLSQNHLAHLEGTETLPNKVEDQNSPSRRNSVSRPDKGGQPVNGGKPVMRKNELSAEALKEYRNSILRNAPPSHIEECKDFYSIVSQSSRLKFLDKTLSLLMEDLAISYVRSMDYDRAFVDPEFRLRNTHWPYAAKFYCLTPQQFNDRVLDAYKKVAHQWKLRNPDLLDKAPDPMQKSPIQVDESLLETGFDGEVPDDKQSELLAPHHTSDHYWGGEQHPINTSDGNFQRMIDEEDDEDEFSIVERPDHDRDHDHYDPNDIDDINIIENEILSE